MRLAIALFTTAAAAFIVLAANMILEQQRLISAAKPVRGTVISSSVKEWTQTDAKSRRTTTFRPVVRYRFNAVGGSIFSSDRVFPSGYYTTKERADQIVADHPAGKEVTVWIDPAKLGESFLLKEWDFSPYLTILVAMGFLSTGLGFWAAAPWRRERVWPPKAVEGGFELPIRATLADRRRPWRVVMLVWFVLGGIVVWHYFHYAEPPYELAALVAAPLYFLLGLLPLLRYWRALRLGRGVRDAKVLSNAEVFRPGKTFDVKVEQRFTKAARVESARVGLICERVEHAAGRNGKIIAKRIVQSESWTDLTKGPQDIAANQSLQGKAKFTAPAEEPATTSEDQSGWPRYSWKIVMRVDAANLGKYEAEYPLIISDASAA